MVEQQSEQWLAEKLGVLSGTRAARVMGTPKVRQTLMEEMIVEIAQAYKKPVDTPRLKQGRLDEPEAVAAYAAFTLDDPHDIQTGAYVEADFHPFITCSPDVLVGDTGGAEIKNLDPKNHFHVVDTGDIDPAHLWQAKWCLMVTGRQWWDVFHYCKHLPVSMRTHRYRIESETFDIAGMRMQAVDFIEVLLNKLEQYGLVL